MERERALTAEVAECVRLSGGRAELNPPLVRARIRHGYAPERLRATTYVVETTMARLAMAAHAAVMRRTGNTRVHDVLQRHWSFERARRSFFAACMTRGNGEPLIDAVGPLGATPHGG